MSQKVYVGILGATGTVGQRFIALLENHPILKLRPLVLPLDLQEEFTLNVLKEPGR